MSHKSTVWSGFCLIIFYTFVLANSASSDEGMGLCYRCPLHHLDGDEGSAYAWVKSFLHEIKRRCPGLKTTPKGRYLMLRMSKCLAVIQGSGEK